MTTIALNPAVSLSRFGPKTEQLIRRALIFDAMLLSGGNLVFNRIVLLAILVLLASLLKSPISLLRRELAGIWIAIASIFTLALIGGGEFNIAANAIRLANFAGAFLLVVVYIDKDRRQISDDLWPILHFFAFQALATVILSIIIPGAFRIFTINDGEYHTILMIFTYHIYLQDSARLFRPDGFFWEPGVLQIYLNIYLFLAIFTYRRLGIAVLATISVIATQSTSGIIIALGLISIGVLKFLATADMKLKLFGVIIAPVILIPLVAVAVVNVNDKLFGEARGSSWARQYDAITGFRIAAAYPLTGIGFDYDRYNQESEVYGYRDVDLNDDHITDRGNTNSFSALFASLGFPMGLMIMIGLVRQRFFRERLTFSMIMLISLSSESLLLTPFFSMLVFSGLLLPTTRRVVG